MSAAEIVLLALAGAGLLALGHHAFWTRRLLAPAAEDARVVARTRDDWELALGRRLPRGAPRRPPVLLCHGLSANRWMLDAGVEGRSLAAFLAGAGLDCFALDLRGHGGSRRGPPGSGRWSFDTYLAEDVPAALEAVRAATGEERVLWVGHSLGALLGMAACQVHGGRIAGLVAMTAPFAGALPLRAVEGIVARDNMERPVYRRLMANGIEDVPPGVFAQLRGWVREDAFRSADGTVDYRAGLAACRQPALFVGASQDRLARPASAWAGYQRWGGPKELFVAGREGGLAADYSHADLLLGRRAREEIFPRVRDWLLAHAGPSPVR